MMSGSFQNRLFENKMFCDKIEVGTGVTEYMYTDRRCYEVVDVIDDKHCYIRELDAKLVGEAYSNDWELYSNENNPVMYLTKRGKYWYSTVTATADMIKEFDSEVDEHQRFTNLMWLIHNNFDRDIIIKKGKQTRYHRLNISFGVTDYYYDYSF